MTMSNAIFEQQNPFAQGTSLKKIAEPCIMVIFGATGDLTGRKLLPALYNLAKDGQLPAHFACVGFARRDKSDVEFREEMKENVESFSRSKPVDSELWQNFSEQLFYHKSEFHEDDGYISLKKQLDELDTRFGTRGNRVYYLSTQPSFFPLIIEKLSQHGLIYKPGDEKTSRVIIEKPFGHNLNSAIALQEEIAHYLDEDQIYRIDHYLGKETVQNLLVLRFSNPIFESLWNNHQIDNVQITVAEEIGIGTRGRFWEEAGMLRDIVQNHVMQLLSLVAMEPPTSLTAKAIRDEKVKVMQSVRPFPKDDLGSWVVRGQYGPGYINGVEVKGYREEDNVSKTSFVETYAAIKLYIDNWRWSGVPFYLRAGKRLPKRASEIAITFKDAPAFLFPESEKKLGPNTLVIRIQPNEGVSLKMNCKVPGLAYLQPVKMDFRYGSFFGSTPPEAYERLLCDCMAGDNTLFAHFDEVHASWKLLEPVLQRWSEPPSHNFPNYVSGSWGPKCADELIGKDGRSWRLL